MSRWGLLVLVFAGSACDTDGDVAVVEDAPSPCDIAPVTTWDNFGQAFLASQCNGCHARTSPNRHGAPLAYTFDTESEVLQWRDVILGAATGDAPSMPPAGGVREEDRARLTVWLTCDL
jgi:hypothetical protein